MKKTFAFIGYNASKWARDKNKHEELRSDLSQQFEKQLPKMIEYLAETDPFISLEGTEFTDLLKEAVGAYSHGYWRSVVALIGVAGESLTEKLYCDIEDIFLGTTFRITRQELLGEDRHVGENNKIAALLLCRKIDKPIFDKLRRIKRLRDGCVHHQTNVKPHNIHAEAREAFNLFVEICNWYSEKIHGPIKSGEIITIEKAD